MSTPVISQSIGASPVPATTCKCGAALADVTPFGASFRLLHCTRDGSCSAIAYLADTLREIGAQS